MSTSANIAMKVDGVWQHNRVNWDGYPDAMLPALQVYSTPEAAKALVMGNEIRTIDQGVERYEDTDGDYPYVRPAPTNDESYLYVYENGLWSVR